MYRLVLLAGAWFAYYFEDLSEELNDISLFVENGNPVIIIASLDDLESIGIDRNKVEFEDKD